MYAEKERYIMEFRSSLTFSVKESEVYNSNFLPSRLCLKIISFEILTVVLTSMDGFFGK
jgi:hypothetical protein